MVFAVIYASEYVDDTDIIGIYESKEDADKRWTEKFNEWYQKALKADWQVIPDWEGNNVDEWRTDAIKNKDATVLDIDGAGEIYERIYIAEMPIIPATNKDAPPEEQKIQMVI